MDRSEFLTKALEHYAGCYDIVRTEDSETGLVATAQFHEHGVGYMLIRSAEMWSADRHEYVWFYSVPELTEAVYDRCYTEAFNAGLASVVPGEGHMSSAVVVVFLCDRADANALEKVKKCRYRKDFKFGLNGWMAVHTAAVALQQDVVVSNGEGRNERTFLSSLLHPKARKRAGFLSGLLNRQIIG